MKCISTHTPHRQIINILDFYFSQFTCIFGLLVKIIAIFEYFTIDENVVGAASVVCNRMMCDNTNKSSTLYIW